MGDKITYRIEPTEHHVWRSIQCGGGYGVFAGHEVSEGQIVEEGIFVHEHIDLKELHKSMQSMYVKNNINTDPKAYCHLMGNGSVYSRSRDGKHANAQLVVKSNENRRFEIVATKPIAAYEEIVLLVDERTHVSPIIRVPRILSRIHRAYLSLNKARILDQFSCSTYVGIGKYGYGVFADKDYYEDEVVGTFLLKRVVIDDVTPPGIEDYWLDRTESTRDIMTGIAPIFNGGHRFNVDYQCGNVHDTIKFFATRNIKKGEELFSNYGSKYLEARGYE